MAIEETVVVPQQKNQNENRNLVIPDPHMHVDKDATNTKDSVASCQSSNNITWKKKKKSNPRKSSSWTGEVKNDFLVHCIFLDVFERVTRLYILFDFLVSESNLYAQQSVFDILCSGVKTRLCFLCE